MLQKLEEIKNNLPYFQQTYPEDTCMILCDKDTIIGYLPGERVDLKLKVGEKMEKYKGAATYKVLQSGKQLREEVPANFLGIPYISSCIPLYENGQMIGALAAVTSNEKIENLRKSADELSKVIEQMTAFSEEITKATDTSASRLQELSQQSETMKDNMKNIERIIGHVKGIAQKSNILGLNAAIEAARSGESGKGFAVVADEIRKMAANSNTAAEDIQKQLELTEQDILKINNSVQDVAAQTEEYSASIQEFHSMLEQVSATASLLSDQGKV
ncbi:methyl-accepting chemotaxis-like protein [Bacillus sp. OxB-1]|nr:methyl-accepting chemotaxis protein [Bacillus sp. OxB-1]BAQ09679.1 methyl-accepting chemotaxis-like protein [Bacillus sp. OxB-1]